MKSYTTTKDTILTQREIQYLLLAADGCKNLEIAQILYVSNSTVKKTFENIFLKLKARTKAQALSIAYVHDIITKEDLANTSNLYNSDIF